MFCEIYSHDKKPESFVAVLILPKSERDILLEDADGRENNWSSPGKPLTPIHTIWATHVLLFLFIHCL